MANSYESVETQCITSQIGKRPFFHTENSEKLLKINEEDSKNLKLGEMGLCVSVSKYSSIFTTEDEYEPALANWNKWLKVHKSQQNKLSMQVKRPPQCLIMNSSLNNLYVNQEKKNIADANNYTFCDKYRGHPNFWIADNNLKNNGKSFGIYQTIQQKYDRSRGEQQQNHCLMPEQKEYIGVPEAILREKGLSEKPCLPTPQEKWDKSEHVFEKRELLKEKLRFIQQHRPSISNLAVVGIPPVQSSPFYENMESIEKAEIDSDNMPTYLSEETQEPISVMIGEKEIQGNVKPWAVVFENCLVNEVYNIGVNIQNLQDSCLRYSWSLELPHWTHSDLPIKYLKNRGKCFYFDKNNGVILPGCEYKIMFQFQSTEVGVFSETWNLHISHEPDQWNVKTFQLCAVAVEALDCTKNTEAIDSYLDSCTKYTIARKLVEEILHKNRTLKQELPYNFKFFEEQIFIHNNPELFYDNKCVHTLKNLHAKISEGPWDYSVNNLRRELFKKSLNENLSEELEVYSSTIYQLLKPSLPISLLNEKRKSVYELLRCFVDKIDLESANLMFINQNYSTKSYRSQASKLSAESSWLSKTLSRVSSKNISSQSRSISKKSSDNTYNIDYVSKTQSYNSTVYLKTSMRKQEYLEALYVKTYHHLGQTINQISAIIDSFEAQSKKNILNALRDHYN